jgi:glycosyltransferase involved in cell wall biosynthesis
MHMMLDPNPKTPICLDVTRLLSRAGLGALTGVDRVERAYVEWALLGERTATFLCRTSRGYLLIDPNGARALLDGLSGTQKWQPADLISKIMGRRDRKRDHAEATLRQHIIARALPTGLGRMLRRHLPDETIYLNVGHSNLSQRVLGAWAKRTGGLCAVLIHDLIPVSHPEFSTPDSTRRFEEILTRLPTNCDLIIANSRDTADRLANYWKDVSQLPRICVSHLGLAPPPAIEPIEIDTETPFFVAVGTLEPRKNLTLLLDIWERLARNGGQNPLPHLHIVGRRGWLSSALFERIDTHPLNGIALFEHGALSDAQTQYLIEQSQGLLFPSLAEGFGLPPLEALALGKPVICSNLPVLREILGNKAIFLDPSDPDIWVETIQKKLNGMLEVAGLDDFSIPTWHAHFNQIDVALENLPPQRSRKA